MKRRWGSAHFITRASPRTRPKTNERMFDNIAAGIVVSRTSPCRASFAVESRFTSPNEPSAPVRVRHAHPVRGLRGRANCPNRAEQRLRCLVGLNDVYLRAGSMQPFD